MIQIDVWGGDLHQNLVREHFAEDWAKASALIEAEVEAGCLVNVLHLDFKCPPDKGQEAAVDLIHNLAAMEVKP